jgi:hypothetical protein
MSFQTKRVSDWQYTAANLDHLVWKYSLVTLSVMSFVVQMAEPLNSDLAQRARVSMLELKSEILMWSQ